MDKIYWTSTDIQKLFRLHERIRSRQTLFNAEERGEIPRAERVLRGRQLIRHWTMDQLPEIGARYGFLTKPPRQEVICVYTAKGGVLKTTLTYCLGRLLALNGIRTLLIGLDIQCSLTELALPSVSVESLDEYEYRQTPGLYHLLLEGASLEEVVQKTGLPTLDIIPETTELNGLEKRLRLETRREYYFRDHLIRWLGEYDVVMFDNGPNWSQLIENALVAANTIISPIGCDLGTYQALKTNLNSVTDFQQSMKLDWANFMLVPTLLEKSKLSQQIYGAYLNQYGDLIVPSPVRRAIKGQEALVFRQTPLEYDPVGALSQDYYELSTQMWERVLKSQRTALAA
jgi:chromosome partitioning protein